MFFSGDATKKEPEKRRERKQKQIDECSSCLRVCSGSRAYGLVGTAPAEDAGDVPAFSGITSLAEQVRNLWGSGDSQGVQPGRKMCHWNS